MQAERENLAIAGTPACVAEMAGSLGKWDLTPKRVLD